MATYHASAADRITQITQKLAQAGRVTGAYDRLDPFARALWHKRDFWAAKAHLDRIGWDSDRPGYHDARDLYDTAESAHELLIRDLWMKRFCDNEAKAWRAIPAAEHLFSDAASVPNV